MMLQLRLVSYLLSICMLDAATRYTLPHPGCFLNDYGWLVCNKANLRLPGSFNVSELQTFQADPIKEISLSCPERYTKYCNFVSKDVQPFPLIPTLESVELYGFKTDEGHVLPVDKLLRKNKGHLVKLTMWGSKIEKLDSRFMRGFNRLEHLDLMGKISEISVDTFENAANNLKELFLSSNALTRFDWGVIKPLAGSLKKLSLGLQTPSLQSLHCTTVTFHIKLELLWLAANQLSTIPTEVLNTIVVEAGKKLEIHLGSNPICPKNPDCSCCALKSIARWYASLSSPENVRIIGRCGPEWDHHITDPVRYFMTSNETEKLQLLHYVKPMPISAYARCP